jgi:hypothetical protein
MLLERLRANHFRRTFFKRSHARCGAAAGNISFFRTRFGSNISRRQSLHTGRLARRRGRLLSRNGRVGITADIHGHRIEPAAKSVACLAISCAFASLEYARGGVFVDALPVLPPRTDGYVVS